jgi:predicted ferric reductase
MSCASTSTQTRPKSDTRKTAKSADSVSSIVPSMQLQLRMGKQSQPSPLGNIMNRWLFIPLFVGIFVGAPVALALSQQVPTQSTYQQIVLLASITAAGLALGLFWLSRLTPKETVNIRLGKILSWHKYIGYTIGVIFLIHPVLIIARRFQAVESNPIDNLILLFTSPLVWPGVAAWILLIVLVLSAFFRKKFAASTFRKLHGWLAVSFIILGIWHALSIGRHSNWVLATLWITLAAAAIAAFLNRTFNKRIHQ